MDGADTRWIEPERARSLGERDPLTPQQVDRWREEGFALVDGLLPPALIEDCLLYTSPSPRDVEESRMPSSA